ncbi:hypothetical protein QZH41_008727 [Actinostola sp. cb2023]|nr:hypothetical protein QZH41_008727 [Actinostola sp. cb2023]
MKPSSNMKAITDGNSTHTTTLAVSQSWAGFHHSTAIAQKADFLDGGTCNIIKNDENEESYDDTYVPDDTMAYSSSESDYESICSESIPDISQSFINNQSVSTPQTVTSRRSSGRLSSTPRQSQSKLKNSRRSDFTPSHSYNLRPRQSNPSSPYMYNNSILNMPSPSTLEELVQSLKQSTKKYTAVMKKHKGSGKELFSSDDER